MLIPQKINLLSFLCILACFFLPWIDFTCAESSLVTQNGFQAAIGSGSLSNSVDEALMPWTAEESNEGNESSNKETESSNPKDPLSQSWLFSVPLALVFLLAITGFVFSLKNGIHYYCGAISILVACIVLLSFQAIVEFPIAKYASYSNPKEPPQSISEDSLLEDSLESIAGATMSFDTETQIGFFLCLGAAIIPLVFVFLLNPFQNESRDKIIRLITKPISTIPILVIALGVLGQLGANTLLKANVLKEAKAEKEKELWTELTQYLKDNRNLDYDIGSHINPDRQIIGEIRLAKDLPQTENAAEKYVIVCTKLANLNLSKIVRHRGYYGGVLRCFGHKPFRYYLTNDFSETFEFDTLPQTNPDEVGILVSLKNSNSAEEFLTLLKDLQNAL